MFAGLFQWGCGQPAPEPSAVSTQPAPPGGQQPAPAQPPVPAAQTGMVTAAAGPHGVHGPFPDFGFLPSRDVYTGPVFRLSQACPAEPPPAANLPAFMTMDFRNNWRNYMLAVRSYCFDGNTDADWRVENNAVRSW